MTSPIVVPTTAGRPVSSARRPATRPMIPTGHGPWMTSAGASAPPPMTIGARVGAAPGAAAPGPAPRPGPAGRAAARASAIAVRIRSRRVELAVSSVAASAAASSGVSASRRRAASSASPTRPAALSRGASTNPTVSRSTDAGATRARSRSAAIPGRGRGAHPLQAEAGDRPVLAQDRRHVRHGADRGQVGEVEGVRLRGHELAEEQARDRERHAASPRAPGPGRSSPTRCGLTMRDGGREDRRAGGGGPSRSRRSPRAGRRGDLRDARGARVHGHDQGDPGRPTAAATAASERPWPSSSRDGTYGLVSIPRRRRAMHELRQAREPVRVEVAEHHHALARPRGRGRPARPARRRPAAGAGR